jgi:fermentation-respiration switch protein FrsA (DUF1100 family)
MTALKTLLIVALVGYAGILAALYVWQRSLMYFPETVRTLPASAGLLDAQEITLTTADGETLIAWYRAPAEGRPMILYFHGNAGSLRLRADRFRKLIARGNGLLGLSYRGYGGSSGRPSEAGLIEDARAAYSYAAERVPHDRIVAFGESLGTGVAIALAAERPVAKLILDAPYSSAADIAAKAYPFAPVRLLMKDQFRSAERMAQVDAPVLIMHGEMDQVIPIASAEKLYASIKGRKDFVRFPAGMHVDLDSHGAQEAIENFLSQPN